MKHPDTEFGPGDLATARDPYALLAAERAPAEPSGSDGGAGNQ